MAMALLNGLPDRFDSLISALDAANIDDQKFSFEFVQSRCLQEEQRHTQRDNDSLKAAETAALFTKANKNTSVTAEICIHCGKHRDSKRCCCYKKYPHLAPKGHPSRAHLDNPITSGKTVACVAMEPTKEPDEQSEDEVCLLSICSLRHAQLDIDCMDPSAPPSVRANQVCLVTPSNTSNVALHSVKELPPPSLDWIID